MHANFEHLFELFDAESRRLERIVQPPSQSSGFPFGQKTELTRTIHRLIREYPEGVGILKELVQNADDARASIIELVFDWRLHRDDRLPDSRMRALMGPSLLAYNDAEFTQKDFDDIQEIGFGGKLESPTKTGRFGVGFNSVYNVTDWPHFISGNRIAFFDPHCSAIPGADRLSPGFGWRLDNDACWDLFPGLLAAFEPVGLGGGATYLKGTAFRLPMRTREKAIGNAICETPFLRENADELVAEMRSVIGSILLFLKHLQHIRVREISVDGVRRELLSAETLNADEVRSARAKVLDFLGDDTKEVLFSRLSEHASNLPRSAYMHEILVSNGEDSLHTRWRVVNGLFLDPAGELLNANAEMLRIKEKALPWAGAAAMLTTLPQSQISDEKQTETQSLGGIACFLPLPVLMNLPVQLHGFFDLGEARTAPTVGEGDGGPHRVRAQWNRMLVRHGVADAYAHLLHAIAADVGESNPKYFYRLWPGGATQAAPFEDIATHVAEHLRDFPIIRATQASDGMKSSAGRWLASDKASFLAPEDEDVFEPLAAQGVPLVEPALPDHVMNALKVAKISPSRFTPTRLRELLNKQFHCGVLPEDTGCPCLASYERILSLLRFCLRELKFVLTGMPLAITQDGLVRQYGQHPSGAMYLADERERAILEPLQSQFLDLRLQHEPGILADTRTGLARMSPTLLVGELAKLSFLQGVAPREWAAQDDALPNHGWLALVYNYLTDAKRNTNFNLDRDMMGRMCLVPDQMSRLIPPTSAATPLWVPDDTPPELHTALRNLRVPLVEADGTLREAIHAFINAYADLYIWPVCGRDLIDTLATIPTDIFSEPRHEKNLSVVLTFLTGEFLAKGKSMLEEERGKKLRSLPLFPLLNGQRTVLDESVFQPAGFTPPQVAGKLPILWTGPDGSWHALFEALGVKPLDRATLIRKFLVPPRYSTLSTDDQLLALAWIRINIELAGTIAQTNGNRDSLRRELGALPLIMCEDGVPRAAVELYDPRSRIAREVLHDAAVFPARKTYDEEWILWLEFFDKLGMVAAPRAADLLRHIDTLAARAVASAVGEATSSLHVMFSHVVNHWTSLANAKVGEGTFAEALRKRAWLPAQRDPEALSSFTAYAVPEERLYRADELFLPESGHLIAAQLPILRFGDTLNRDLRVGLNIALAPSPATVLNQLDSVLRVCGEQRSNVLNGENTRRTFREIYSYIGRTFSVPGESNSNSTSSPQADGDTVRARFGNTPCVWSNGELWPPKWTFRESVSCFGKYRKQISTDRIGVDIRKALEILGQRARPSANDFVEFMYELAAQSSGKPLDDSDRAIMRKVCKQFAILLDDFDQSSGEVATDKLFLTEVPLLSDRQTLVPACDLLLPDAPWITSTLDHERVRLLHTDVPVLLARQARVRPLSEAIEQPTEPVRPSTDARCREWCERVESFVRSNEFRTALTRLIFHQQDFRVTNELDWLPRLSVRASDRIATVLLSKHRVSGELQQIGRGSGDLFFDPSTCTVFVALDDSDWMTQRLAKAINAQLAPTHLADLGILERLLRCQPSRMASVLNKARVRDLPVAVNPTGDEAEEDHASDWDIDAADAAPSDVQPSVNTGEPNAERSGPHPLGTDGSSKDGTSPRTGNDEDSDSAGNNRSHMDTKASDEVGEVPTATEQPSQPASSLQTLNEPATPSPMPKGLEYGDRSDDKDVTPAKNDTNPAPAPTGAPIGLPNDTRPARTGSVVGSGNRKKRNKKKSKSRKPSRDRIITYLAPRLPTGNDGSSDDAGDSADSRFRIELGAAAVKAVCEFEKKAGREPKARHHSNKGFDVKSFDSSTKRARFIEVKGVFGEWNDRGVGISRAQFKMCQDEGDDFWLYVVEHANDATISRVFPIQNPALKATEFRFDGNWRLLSEGYVTEPNAGVAPTQQQQTIVPTQGQHIDVPGRGTGEIIAVTPRGNLWRLKVRFGDGETKIVYDPAKHTIR